MTPVCLVVCIYKGTMSYFILVQYVYEVLSLYLLYIIGITFYSNRLTTENNLTAKIASVATWTNQQRQDEEGLNRKIQEKTNKM